MSANLAECFIKTISFENMKLLLPFNVITIEKRTEILSRPLFLEIRIPTESIFDKIELIGNFATIANIYSEITKPLCKKIIAYQSPKVKLKSHEL